MPSDAKKREQQRKKDAAKARGGTKKAPAPAQKNGETTNGVSNGQNEEISAEGTYILFVLVGIYPALEKVYV